MVAAKARTVEDRLVQDEISEAMDEMGYPPDTFDCGAEECDDTFCSCCDRYWPMTEEDFDRWGRQLERLRMQAAMDEFVARHEELLAALAEDD